MTASHNEPIDLTDAILRGLHQVTDWGILTTDTQMIVTGWSRWLEIKSGLHAENILGRNLLDVFPELKSRRLAQFYDQALHGQAVVLSQRLHGSFLPLPREGAHGAGEGQAMRQSVRIVPVTEQGQVVGTITLIEDVSERVASETELKTRALQQSTLAQLSQQALAGAEFSELAEGAATRVAKALQAKCVEVLELQNGRLVFRGCWGHSMEVTSPDTSPGSQAAFILASPVPVVMDDLRLEARFRAEPRLLAKGATSGLAIRLMRGGEPFGVLAAYDAGARTFPQDGAQFLQAVANVMGMAVERKRLERELRQRADALALADRRKDEFLAMLAHELRNPLAPIRNATAIIQIKAIVDPDVLSARCVIERQVQQMQRLIDDLLDVSRITRGKISFQKERVELAAVIARAVETTQPVMDARQHEFIHTLPAERVWLDADLTRLAQAFGNLLTNAAKYTPERGRIRLDARIEGPEVVVRISDNGVGIPADMLPAIFDMFTQVGRSIDRSEGGLGIGLTLVRSLIALHGGTVEGFSAGPGQGSEFVVHLPTAAPPEETAVPQVPNDTSRLAIQRRILIVDDNKDSAESLGVLLRLTGNDVRLAYDGPTALKEAAAFRPEVILLDIGLPGMNGFEVATELRSTHEARSTIILAMTGYGQDDDRRRSQEAGFDAHLVKPLNFDTLQELVARLLAGAADSK